MKIFQIDRPIAVSHNATIPPRQQDRPVEVRLDRWLWAARFFKTRQLSATALKTGRVELNGRKAKPAKMVHIGDALTIRKEQLRYHITVLDLREKRVSAELAAAMYRESEESIEIRQTLQQQQKAQHRAIRFDDGRPGKKDRRALNRFKRGEFD